MNSILDGSRSQRYFTIQNKPLTLSERDIASCLEAARFDPRLMEIIVEHLRDFWWTLDSNLLNKAMKKQRSPFVIKGALAIILSRCQMNETDRLAFSKWAEQAARGIKDPSPQLLYIGLFPMGSSLEQEEVLNPLPEFRRHNLFVKDLPFNKGRPGNLQSKGSPTFAKLDEADLLKINLGQEIKRLKQIHKWSNTDISRISGINRVFLSRILNNKLEFISAEYLAAAVGKLR